MNGLSVIFNVILLYLIKNHSAFGTPIYQVLLAIDATLDLLLAVVVFLGQPVCLTGGGFKVFMSNGFFAGWSDALDKFFICGFLTVLHYNVMWISIQFVCRYAFLCLQDRYEDAKRIVRIVVVLSVIWGVVGTYVCYIYSHPSADFQQWGEQVFQLNNWETGSKIPVVVGSHISGWLLPGWIAMWSVSCVGGSVVVIIFEMKIKRHFDSMGSNMSHNSTRKMHKDFHRALLAMAICPLFTTAVPIMYYMVAAYLELSPGTSQAFMTMGASSITMFNPLTTISFMRTYRQALLRPFLKNKTRPQDTTRVTGLSVATCVAQTQSAQASGSSR
ncbi:CRE-STR-2 protein [Aphelenchoides avenae]|nr:CRE-STR-2 protein [Aphelenchus avenae]